MKDLTKEKKDSEFFLQALLNATNSTFSLAIQ
jgi:hypothetical protein